MNARPQLPLITIPFVLAGTLTLSGAPEIQFKDLPVPVQQTVSRYKENGELKRIARQIYNGAPVYDVVIKRPGPNRELHITENGTVLENDPNFVANPGPLKTKKPLFNELPPAVQNAVRARAGNAPIDDIDEITQNSGTVYQIEFQRNGQNQELDLTREGTLASAAQLPAPVNTPTTLTVASRKISVNDLPAPARQAAEREAAGAPIEDIDQMTRNGRTFYEVTFKRNGQNVDLDLAPDGSLTDRNGSPIISSQRATPASTAPGTVNPVIAGDRSLTFAELPLPVMKTVQSEVGSGRIDTLERKVRRGKILYQVGYTKNGQQQALFVSDNGNIISGGTSADNQNGPPISLSNASKVTFKELPAAVQNAIRAQAGNAPVEDIDKGMVNGRVAYQAAFKKDGRHAELTVGEDGSVIGGSATVARILPTSPDAAVPLRGARKVTFSELPTAAQNTIRSQAGTAVIEDIDKGELNGRVVYEAAFKRNGKHTELRVGEDGSLVGVVGAELATPQP